jgi:nucleoside-diphosphate-sugar epimerase
MDRVAPEDLYGAAKLYVEQLGKAFRRAHGLQFVSLRIGRVVGPGARSATSAWRSEIFERLAAGEGDIEVPYEESERILLVHVEDVATMLLQLLQAPPPAQCVYNAACDSVVVGELKRVLERLNPRLRVRLGGQAVVGNPRQVDWSRFAGEFGVRMVPMFEQLEKAAGLHRD